MKKILLLIGAIAGTIPAFSQLKTGSQGLTILSGTKFSAGDLILEPSADLTLQNNTLRVSDTPIVVTGGASISKVFTFDPSITYSGKVGIRYNTDELNNNTVDSLQISLFNGQVLWARPSEAGQNGTFTVYSLPLTNVQMNNVTLGDPIPGVITASTSTVSAMSTTYGTASATQTFTIEGANIIDGITVTAPAGFEVSQDNSTFASSIEVDGDGTVGTTTIYVRIKETTKVGSPTGYVVLTSPNSVYAPVDSVEISTSSVLAKSISVTGLVVTSRAYNGNTTATVSSTGTLSGIEGSDNVTLNTNGATYSFDTKDTGTNKTVTVTGYTLGGEDKDNYLLSAVSGTGAITQAPVMVVVLPRTKCYIDGINGIGDTTSAHFSATGFVSGEGIASVDLSSIGFPALSPATIYSVTASNAVGKVGTTMSNYSVVYMPGILTVSPSANATITTAANVQLCSGNSGSIAINTTGTAPFTGRFRILNQMTNAADTFTFTVNNSGPSAPSIPSSYLVNNGISPINYKVSWASLKENNSSCPAADNQLTGEVIITVFPVPSIDANATALSLCNGAATEVVAINPNAVGGTYNVLAQYNGVTGGTVPVNGLTNRQYSAGPIQETLSLNDTVTSPVTVRYIFTPITTNTSYSCVGANDTVKVVVNPKPRFDFAVNSAVVANNGTDTICQAAPTTFGLTNATNGHTFTVKHTWIDGNSVTHTNNTYATGTIADGGFSHEFTSGGNSVNPGVDTTDEPTAGTYEITVSNPAFTGCTTTKTFHIYVNPKPEFAFAVNGNTVAINGTDTICQAAPTTFAITNATDGHEYEITHTWIDGNDSTHTTEYASGTISGGGISNSFTSGGNSVNPAVNPGNEPTAGAYKITMTNPATGCVTTRTFNVYVQPKPEFAFTVNGDAMAIGSTDTICQAATTTFAITNATSGHLFAVKHTWIDGDSIVHVNNNYATDTIVDGGFSHEFVSGGNSVNPGVDTTDEPTAGAYEITLTNPETGCTTTRIFNIYVNPKPQFSFEVNGNTVAINGTDTICQAAPTTFAITNATDGHEYEITHTWIDGNDSTHTTDYASGTISGGGISNSFTSGGNSVNPAVNPGNEPTAGAYKITMTNPVTGCVTTRTFNVYVQPKPQFSVEVNGNEMAIGGTDTICQASPTIFAITNATNGHAFSIKHTWIDGNSVSHESTYGTDTIVNGGFSTSFISGGNSVNPGVDTTDEPTAGAYEITLTNPTTGCTTTRTFNIYVNPKPQFSFEVNGNEMAIGGTDTICQAAPTFFAIANATNGHTFVVKHTWINGVGDTVVNNNYASDTIANGGFEGPMFTSGGNSVNPGVDTTDEPTAGAYEITMTNPITGCTTTRVFNIYVNPKPVDLFKFDGVVLNNNEEVTRCAGIAVSLNLEGDSTHSYQLLRSSIGFVPSFDTMAVGQVNDSALTFTANTSIAGEYMLILTDDNTGCTKALHYTFVVNEAPAYVTAPDSLVVSNDAGNCTALVTYAAEAEGSGTVSYTHEMTGATTTTGFVAGTGSGTVFNKGVTTVTIKASNGLCADKDTTFTVTVNDTEKPTISYTAGNLNGQSNHAACTYTVSTAAPVIADNCGTTGLKLNYELSGATVAADSGVVGSYNFNVGTTTVRYTVEDIAGNKDTVSYTVTVGSSAPSLSVNSPTNVTCFGGNDGSFHIQYANPVSGNTTITVRNVSTGNIIYTANNPISSLILTQGGMSAGTYRVYVSNTYGCVDSADITINQPASALNFGTTGLVATNIVCGSPNSGKIKFGVAGGNPGIVGYVVAVNGPGQGTTPYTSFISPAAFENYELTGLAPGTYTVTVADAGTCGVLMQSVTITAPTQNINSSVTTQGTPVCVNSTAVNVVFTASGGTAPYTFSYTDINGPHTVVSTNNTATITQSTSAVGAFTYTLTGVTDANGAVCNNQMTQTTATVNVASCGGPDLIPVVMMPAASFSASNTSRAVTLNLGNIGNGPTENLISVTILKPTPGFTFTPNLPNGWTVVDNGYTLTFSSMNVIAPGEAVTLTGTLNRSTGANAPGIYTMTTFVNNGSGGESNTVNNVKFTTITMNP